MDRAVILGASRGLGAELVKHIASQRYPVFGFARKEAAMGAMRSRFSNFDYRVSDFSARHGQDDAIRFLLEENYTKIFCVAGGGPYGPYVDRAMKDHEWAWEVSFHFPARLIHALGLAKRFGQLILVGSAVAESSADPGGASYSAAKHALKGLVASVRAENPNWDIRLFSPGYMDTEMLPRNASVREKGVYDPAQIARDLWTWSLSTDKTGHKVYPPHPSC